MVNSSKSSFKWLGSSVKCYKKALDNDMYHTFYRSFNLNGESYNVDDFAICKTDYNGNKVCQITCLYESTADWHVNRTHRGTVKWFTKADDVPSSYKVNIEYDKNNEVVEDQRSYDVFIDLNNILMKCTVVYATLEDPIYVISELNYDSKTHFSCRYRVKDKKLIPLKLEQMTIIHNTENTPNSQSKRKSKKEGIDVLSPNSAISPNKKLNSNSLLKYNNNVATPNRAKRNLNESFDNTPKSQGDTPILNYSIIETEISPLKIKLKLSGINFASPKVHLDRMDGEYINSLLQQKDNTTDDEKIVTKTPKKIAFSDVVESPSIRHSTRKRKEIFTPNKRRSIRNVAPKNYDEDEIFINKVIQVVTELKTPTKRNRSVSVSSDLGVESTTPKKKNKVLEVDVVRRNTPRRTRLNSVESDTSSTISKVSSTPSRTRKISVESCKEVTPKKSPRISKKKETRKNYDSDDDAVSTDTPKKLSKKNIDKNESSKRPIGRPRLTRAVSIESSGTPSKGRTPSRRARAASAVDLIIEELEIEYPPSTPKRMSKKDKIIEEELEETPSKRIRTRVLNTPKKLDDYEHDILSEIISPLRRELKIKKTPQMNTPKKSNTPKKTKTPIKKIPKTPKNTPSARMKLIRDGVITPSMHSRQTAVVNNCTPLNEAKAKLHVSYVPKVLPCREKEFADIIGFVEGKLLDGCGGCMYISGVPGTGKTATVTEVIRSLQEMSKKKNIPKFDYVGINGMRLTEPRQSYVEILKQLTGKTIAWEQAQTMLENKFTKKTSKKAVPVVLLVDELDILCTKRQDVVYNLLDWPTKAVAQLIVITIANTMDLPERLLMGRVTSRLGLTRLTFQAYTHKQLQEIVMKRLMGTKAFNPDAIQLVARKVASVSGDARRALDICRRSAEIAELEGPNTMVSMKHVNEALNVMITQPKVRAIKQCSRLEQLILQAVVAEVERTGVDETTFSDIYTMLVSVAGIDGFKMVSPTLVMAAISRLGSCRLLLADQKSTDLYQKIILNASSDDIYYALKKD